MNDVKSQCSSSSLSWNEIKSIPTESEGINFESLNCSQQLDDSDLEYEEFELPDSSQNSCDYIQDSQYPFKVDEIETEEKNKESLDIKTDKDVINDVVYDNEKNLKESEVSKKEEECTEKYNLNELPQKNVDNGNINNQTKDNDSTSNIIEQILSEEENKELSDNKQENVDTVKEEEEEKSGFNESDHSDTEEENDLDEDKELESVTEEEQEEIKTRISKKRILEREESPYITPSKKKKSRNSISGRNSISSGKFLLFKGFNFIITGLKEIPDVLKLVKSKIISLGGVISEGRPETVPRRPSKENIAKYILISNAPQRTIKYLSALAYCVPCVNYKWVLDCAERNKFLKLKKYLLPAGNDLDENSVKIPKWYTKEYFEDIPDELLEPFNDRRIELVGSVKFKKQWKPILKACGARTVDRLGVSDKIDYILAETYPADYVIELAEKINCPICNKEWAIQTIYKRELQDPNKDNRYLM